MKSIQVIIQVFFFVLLIDSFCYGDIEYSYDLNYLNENLHNNQKINALEKQICNKKSKNLWNFFEREVDSNKDSLIDQNELYNSISKQIKNSNLKDIQQEIDRLDKNKTGLIKFKDYINDVYETAFDLDSNDTKNQQEFEEIHLLYKVEKAKWFYISEKSEFLNYEKFYQFKYSEEFPSIYNYESEFVFENYDINKDGLLTVEEFIKGVKIVDESIVNLNDNSFLKEIDSNEDNYLNREEFQIWYNPSFENKINEEKTLLMNNCDENLDGLLSKNEITKNCKLFLEIQLTNFGLDLYEKNKTIKSEL